MVGGKRPLLALVLMLAGTAVPAMAQDTAQEARMRRIEAEVRALQRQVFPGDGKTFTPQVSPAQAGATPAGTPATTPVTDMLARMDAIEAQMARLTAQGEENANKLRQLEARMAASAGTAAAAQVAATPAPVDTPAASSLTAPKAVTTPAPALPAPLVAKPTPAPVVAAPRPAPTTAAAPSSARLAAVRAVAKPQTDDAGDDEYSYGYRLWEAKFYPEAQQQLRLFLDKYPRHTRVSYARNLLGRAYLDDGKPRDAASWFLQNYQANKQGDRAPDSLLFLAESMGRLKDTNRACIAIAEFSETYPREAAGRLKAQYDATRGAVKCN
ncbi:MAG: hypothetical protein KGL44_00150 [Sphingomonadales bacterium]|nr:hypothetical protein [Sphingomonadales bacterium]